MYSICQDHVDEDLMYYYHTCRYRTMLCCAHQGPNNVVVSSVLVKTNKQYTTNKQTKTKNNETGSPLCLRGISHTKRRKASVRSGRTVGRPRYGFLRGSCCLRQPCVVHTRSSVHPPSDRLRPATPPRWTPGARAHSIACRACDGTL